MLHRCFTYKKTYIQTWFFLFFIVFTLSYPLNSLAASELEKIHFDKLGKRLVKDGFDQKQIQQLLNHSDVHFETKGISLFSKHKEKKLNYKQFLSKTNLQKARHYLNKHQSTFHEAEKEYGVEKEIITAVILVETRLGTYLGSSSILNTLSTMAVLSDPASRDFIWKKMLQSGKQKRSKFNSWSDKKANWAYKELKAFLKYTQKEKIDPLSINGSYAGALGISQFMPSNILKLAKDGNDDGQIDLFHHADAITSIANFLKVNGWRPGIKRQKKYKVLLRYNYSKPYANTLIDIAQNLKG